MSLSLNSSPTLKPMKGKANAKSSVGRRASSSVMKIAALKKKTTGIKSVSHLNNWLNSTSKKESPQFSSPHSLGTMRSPEAFLEKLKRARVSEANLKKISKVGHIPFQSGYAGFTQEFLLRNFDPSKDGAEKKTAKKKFLKRKSKAFIHSPLPSGNTRLTSREGVLPDIHARTGSLSPDFKSGSHTDRPMYRAMLDSALSDEETNTSLQRLPFSGSDMTPESSRQFKIHLSPDPSELSGQKDSSPGEDELRPFRSVSLVLHPVQTLSGRLTGLSSHNVSEEEQESDDAQEGDHDDRRVLRVPERSFHKKKSFKQHPSSSASELTSTNLLSTSHTPSLEFKEKPQIKAPISETTSTFLQLKRWASESNNGLLIPKDDSQKSKGTSSAEEDSLSLNMSSKEGGLFLSSGLHPTELSLTSSPKDEEHETVKFENFSPATMMNLHELGDFDETISEIVEGESASGVGTNRENRETIISFTRQEEFDRGQIIQRTDGADKTPMSSYSQSFPNSDHEASSDDDEGGVEDYAHASILTGETEKFDQDAKRVEKFLKSEEECNKNSLPEIGGTIKRYFKIGAKEGHMLDTIGAKKKKADKKMARIKNLKDRLHQVNFDQAVKGNATLEELRKISTERFPHFRDKIRKFNEGQLVVLNQGYRKRNNPLLRAKVTPNPERRWSGGHSSREEHAFHKQQQQQQQNDEHRVETPTETDKILADFATKEARMEYDQEYLARYWSDKLSPRFLLRKKPLKRKLQDKHRYLMQQKDLTLRKREMSLK